MKVVVNKCRYTGKLFEDDKKYAAHLQKMRREQKAIREANIIRQEFYAWLANERETLYNPNELPAWILKNQQYLMKSCNALGFGGSFGDKFHSADKFTNIEFENIRFSPKVSNSHSYPKNGVQNWGSKPGIPTGYPGWSGYIKGTLVRDKKHMSSCPYTGILHLININTGSGGGVHANWGYDFKIFLDDWPKFGEEETFKRLMSAK